MCEKLLHSMTTNELRTQETHENQEISSNAANNNNNAQNARHARNLKENNFPLTRTDSTATAHHGGQRRYLNPNCSNRRTKSLKENF